MTALCVPDQAGGHGTGGPPAPLQIAHCVLIQVACRHQRAARPRAPRRKLQPALSCQETGSEVDKRKGCQPAPTTFSRFNGQNVRPYHRGVMLRNIFNPMRGPKMSPAPNSTCSDGYRHKPAEWGLFRKYKLLLPTDANQQGGVFERTSPHPLADRTLRTVTLMLPPPLPLCVDREPDSIAVSLFVRGA